MAQKSGCYIIFGLQCDSLSLLYHTGATPDEVDEAGAKQLFDEAMNKGYVTSQSIVIVTRFGKTRLNAKTKKIELATRGERASP